MTTTEKSPQFTRQRRFMLLLPLVILPFASLLFFLLGGGQANQASAAARPAGLNTTLPRASLARSITDKLGYYENAAKDSAFISRNLRYDPFQAERQPAAFSGQTAPSAQPASADPTEEKIHQRLKELNRLINQPEQELTREAPRSEARPKKQDAEAAELSSLEQMMDQMESSGQTDPELSQLQQLLDKIQEIQHPELLSAKLTGKNEKAIIYQAVPALVAKKQKVTDGTVVEIRLLDTVTINGQLIPKGHQLYGVARLSNQRMNLTIGSIRLGRSILPVNLTVFDQRDGMEGVYLPDALTAEAARGGAENALQDIQILSMDQKVGTQLAGAGITAAKGLFRKKIWLLKGKIDAGYPLLLKDNNKH